MQALTGITKVPLHWYGGKATLGPWIISYMPKHDNYLEPFCGGVSVLLRKPRSDLETISDLDGRLVNFFKVLRDRPFDLIHQLSLTPWARSEFEASLIKSDDPLEDARLFYVKSWMAFGGDSAAKAGNFRVWTVTQGDVADKWLDFIMSLDAVANRLMGVQIENMDAFELIPRYNTPNCLIYADPPYLMETRVNRVGYEFEMDEAGHVKLAELLHQHTGFVILSGYATALYADLYEKRGWVREDKTTQTTGNTDRVESIWLSPNTVDALAKPKQASLW